MPRVNRREIFADDEIQAFHVINRCVRRTFLCGKDRKTGRDFSHRKQWIRERLEVLAGIFAIDVLGFAVLSNHLHAVVRTRPDVVKTWSDAELAVRWWNLFPQRRLQDGSPAEPTEPELHHIRSDASALKEKRKRLANVSWFMKCLSEPIAKRGNREEEVTGHFWEARYKVQPLLDEMAIAACMAYVDLNPIRAGIALTPETSDFTSVQERIVDRRLAMNNPEESQAPSSGLAATFSPGTEAKGRVENAQREKGRGGDAMDRRLEHGERAGWLAPIALDPPRKKVREKPSSRRASNKGCLPLTLDQYLKLLDWTGRQLRKDKAGQIPAEFDPILERLDCSAESWLDLVQNFRKRFRTEAGLAASMQSVSSARRSRRHENSSA